MDIRGKIFLSKLVSNSVNSVPKCAFHQGNPVCIFITYYK